MYFNFHLSVTNFMLHVQIFCEQTFSYFKNNFVARKYINMPIKHTDLNFIVAIKNYKRNKINIFLNLLGTVHARAIK